MVCITKVVFKCLVPVFYRSAPVTPLYTIYTSQVAFVTCFWFPICRGCIVSPDGYSRYVLPVGAKEAVTIAEYQITGLMATIDAVSKNPAPAMAPSAAPEGVTVRRQ